MNGRQHLKLWFFTTAAVALIGASTLSDRGVSAQDATPTAAVSGASTVTVNGTGSVTITPDEASISVGVNIVNASLAEAQAQATTQMNQVIDALKAAGIAELDIQTTNYSVNVIQEYDTNGYPARVSGYQVSNQVNVKVRDISKLGDILEAAVAAGANSIYGVSFVVSDSADAAKQARTDAVAAATSKAQQIADATGMSLGRVVSVTETNGPPPMPLPYGGAEMAKSDMSAVPIQGGGNVITVDVQMTFELVP